MTGEIKYTKRFNLGNYEHEEFSITAPVDEGAIIYEEFQSLKGIVQAAHEGDPEAAEAVSKGGDDEEENTPAATTGKKKKAKKAAKPAEDEEDEDEETEDEEENDEDDSDDDDDTEDEEDPEEEEEKARASAAAAKKAAAKAKAGKAAPASGKSKRSKETSYSRANDIHKKLFTETVKGFYPKQFKTEAGKDAAKKASLKLDGTPFLDSNGKVCDEFIGSLRKALSPAKKK